MIKIPPLITDRLGKMWDQPPLEDLWFFDDIVVMTRKSLKDLSEYSRTIPTGTYAGKMWYSNRHGDLMLHWFEDIPNNTEQIAMVHRPIVLLEIPDV